MCASRGTSHSRFPLFENPRFSKLSSNGKLPFSDPFPFSCPKGDSNPYADKSHAPQACVYTNSTIGASFFVLLKKDFRFSRLLFGTSLSNNFFRCNFDWSFCFFFIFSGLFHRSAKISILHFERFGTTLTDKI